MSHAELAKVRYQLQQIEATLQLDPGNAELEGLAETMRETVAVLEQLVAADTSAAATTTKPSGRSSKPEGAWKTGDECEAQFTDGRWYRARVTSVAPDRRSFTVLYLEYGNSAELDADKLRALPAGTKRSGGGGSDGEASGKGGAAADSTERREIKKQKSKDRQERFKAQVEEQNKRQNDWKSFAQKKAKTIPGVANKSIFATPEGYKGRVGVVNSGKGVTEYQGRKRHEYDAAEDAATGGGNVGAPAGDD